MVAAIPGEAQTKLPEWTLVPNNVNYNWPAYTSQKKTTWKGKTYSYKVSKEKKYDGKVGKFSRQIFFYMGVEVSLGDVLVKAGNQSCAVDTWRKHNLAEAQV